MLALRRDKLQSTLFRSFSGQSVIREARYAWQRWNVLIQALCSEATSIMT